MGNLDKKFDPTIPGQYGQQLQDLIRAMTHDDWRMRPKAYMFDHAAQYFKKVGKKIPEPSKENYKLYDE